MKQYLTMIMLLAALLSIPSCQKLDMDYGILPDSETPMSKHPITTELWEDVAIVGSDWKLVHTTYYWREGVWQLWTGDVIGNCVLSFKEHTYVSNNIEYSWSVDLRTSRLTLDNDTYTMLNVSPERIYIMTNKGRLSILNRK